jgi:hypothetical protein
MDSKIIVRVNLQLYEYFHFFFLIDGRITLSKFRFDCASIIG